MIDVEEAYLQKAVYRMVRKKLDPAWRKRSAEVGRLSSLKWRQQYPERSAESARKYAQKVGTDVLTMYRTLLNLYSRETYLKRVREYRKKNIERIREQNRNWKRENYIPVAERV